MNIVSTYFVDLSGWLFLMGMYLKSAASAKRPDRFTLNIQLYIHLKLEDGR